MPIHEFRIQLAARACIDRHKLALALDQAQEVPVTGITRVRHQHARARVYQQCCNQQQRPGCTRGHHNAFRRHIQTIPVPVPARKSFAQGRYAGRRRVPGMTLCQGSPSGLDNRCRGRKIRLARRQVEDFTAGRLQLPSPRQYLDHPEGLDIGDPSRESVRPLRCLHDCPSGLYKYPF